MEDGISDTLRTDSNRNGKEGTILGTLVRPVAGTLDANYGKGPGERGGAEREYLAEMAADAASYGRFWNGAEVAETLTCTSDDQRMPDKNRMQVVLQGTAGFYPTAGQDFPVLNGCSPPMKVGSGGTSGNPHGRKVEVGVRHDRVVRRLTPVECERLQAFPDGWTQIAWKKKPLAECPDGPRYKALGNSMAVNCMAWIGRRIVLVDETFAELEALEEEAGGET